MRIKKVHARAFKRFTDLTIEDLLPTCRLVVMIGPNGCGKSSVLDAFKLWHACAGYGGCSPNETYHRKHGLDEISWHENVEIEFHTPPPQDQESQQKIFYIRSAYRNQADFTLSQLRRTGSLFDAPTVGRLIDNDVRVEDNYQRLVSRTVEGVYSGDFDQSSVRDLREELIARVRKPMRHLFGDLRFSGLGDPLNNGSFFFQKGLEHSFHYKNLSGGEKAAFDILLDFILKQAAYDDTVFCIDEPDGHMHTELQGRLLQELFNLVGDNSQLWIATHSIGMMRKAKDLEGANPGAVAFLDFHNQDFDKPVTLRPRLVNRDFWAQTLAIGLDDLAKLIAPREVVLCEGRPAGLGDPARGEFDARCYRTIFSREYPETDFISGGNATDVQTDQMQLGGALKRLVEGTKVCRLIDRDSRNEKEIADLKEKGCRVLSRRHIEAYLLDDEILRSLCVTQRQGEKTGEVLAAMKAAIEASVTRDNPSDDLKSAAGEFYTRVQKILDLPAAGSTSTAFLRDTLAPLVRPETSVYQQLKSDIFGDSGT